jgi:hypothetical protein
MKERFFVIALVLICVIFLVYTDFGKGPRVYDCSLSEISPDYPIEVKEACRKLRSNDKKSPSNYI